MNLFEHKKNQKKPVKRNQKERKEITSSKNLILGNKIEKVQQTTIKNSISQEQINHMLNNIDKDNQVIFDKE